MSELKTLNDWLDSETQGLKKGFDKNALIFSYNDILDLKQEGIKWVKWNKKEESKRNEIMDLHSRIDDLIHFFNISEEDLK